jgi:hypothetical protein
MSSPIRKAMWWLWDHLWIVTVLLVAVLGWALFRWRDGKGAMATVQDELDVIRAGSAAREMQIQLGTDQTVQHVKDKYQAKTVALDATQQARVRELEDDPVALARYLERITRG